MTISLSYQAIRQTIGAFAALATHDKGDLPAALDPDREALMRVVTETAFYHACARMQPWLEGIDDADGRLDMELRLPQGKTLDATALRRDLEQLVALNALCALGLGGQPGLDTVAADTLAAAIALRLRPPLPTSRR